MKYEYRVMCIDMPEYNGGDCKYIGAYSTAEAAFMLKKELDDNHTNDNVFYLVEIVVVPEKGE